MVMVLVNGMKDMLVPIDRAGRVVLPKIVREDLAIKPGDMLKVSIHGNEVTLSPKKGAAGFVRKGRALVFSSSGADLLKRETVEAILTNEREEQAIGIAGGLSLGKRRR